MGSMPFLKKLEKKLGRVLQLVKQCEKKGK